MYKIQTLNKISPLGLNLLPKDLYDISDTHPDPDGILVRSAALHGAPLPPSLKAIARAGAGVNNIPVDLCGEAGVVVFNTPGANANAVKELVVAGLLLSSRKIVDGIHWARALTGDVAKEVEKGKSAYIGPELLGKTLGVIGLGAIGVLVANACASLGMEVLGYDPFLSVNSAWSLSRSVKKAPDLETVYASADYLTLHVPLNSDTKHMLNQDTLAKVKPGVRIMNFSRGDLADEAALTAALAQGKVSAYVTDFPSPGLLALPNVLPIPHLGASTPESEDNCAVMAASQLRRYLEEGSIENSVNFPDCVLPRTGRARVCVLHKNVVNVVAPLTSALAGHGINIDNMINKSRGALAYTMIDVDNCKPSGQLNTVAEEVSKVEGVIRARVL
jgi:D-3-phosphoglycerate dehydrogenase